MTYSFTMLEGRSIVGIQEIFFSKFGILFLNNIIHAVDVCFK